MKAFEARYDKRLTWLGLGIILALGLTVRAVIADIAPVFLEGDSQSYLLPAWELAHGYQFSPELRRTPGYPLFITGSMLMLGEDLERLALAQHAIGLGTAALAFLIGRRLFGPLAGLLAGLAVSLSGSQLIYERYVMTEALFGFVLALVGLALVAAMQQPTRWRMLLAGLSIGAAALVRPVAQAVLPLFILAVIIHLPRWRPALKAVAPVLAGYAVFVAPWVARNAFAHETPAAAGGLGRSLIARTVKYDTLFDWKWLSETYGGREDLAARERMLLYRKRANIPESRSVRSYQDALIEELGLSQGQAESAMRQIAIEAIARRPLDYLGGSLFFTGQIFLGRQEPVQAHWRQRASKEWQEQWDDRLDHLVGSVTPEQNSRQPVAAALTTIYQPAQLSWLLLILAVGACLVAAADPARRPAILLGAVVIALISLSAFLDGPVLRYRYPLDPLIAVPAAGGLVTAVEAVLARSLRLPDKLRPRASPRLATRSPES
jgi:4-amino-4-deoxy-L-arabinose transferase-like glycosyltransferase